VSDDDLDDVLSVEEAAALLKVPPATVRREARAGRLPGRHVGKQWRFARSALIDWLRGELEGTGEPPERYARPSRNHTADEERGRA
jgi:excisionase family DNA binding protein